MYIYVCIVRTIFLPLENCACGALAVELNQNSYPHWNSLILDDYISPESFELSFKQVIFKK